MANPPKKRGPKPGMTAAKIVVRNGLICKLAGEGVRNSDIAARVGLTVAQVRSIIKTESNRHEVMTGSSLKDMIHWHLAENMRSIEAYMHEYLQAEAAADRIAALKAKDAVVSKTMKMLSQLYLVPSNYGTYRGVLDFQDLARQVVLKLEAVDRKEIGMDEAMSWFRHLGLLGESQGPRVLPNGIVVVDGSAEAA